MDIRQAYRYELDPNASTRMLLAKHAGTARFAWNWALGRRIERFHAHEGNERFSSAITDHREWNVWKRENAPWSAEVSKCAPQEAFRDLDRAYKAVRDARKAGRRVGLPRFKRKGVHDSFRLSTGALRALPRSVVLPRLGEIRTKEPTALKGRILSATVSRVADRWFVSFTVARERPTPMPVTGPVVGVDLGLIIFAMLSDGTGVEAPRPLRRHMRRLQQLSKAHARKEKGSARRRDSAMRLARHHADIANVRRDFLHKFTTMLAKTKRAIVVEDLNVRGLCRTRLARGIADSGWSQARRMLEYKTKWYGSQLVVAPRFFPSSKLCSGCGAKKDGMTLSTRVYVCEHCGLVIDRDLNAALNLQQYGEEQLARPSVSSHRDDNVARGGEGADVCPAAHVKPSPSKREAGLVRDVHD